MVSVSLPCAKSESRFDFGFELKSIVSNLRIVLSAVEIDVAPSRRCRPLTENVPFQVLDLGNNKFKEIPSVLFDLPSLEKILLNDNQIVALPPHVCTLGRPLSSTLVFSHDRTNFIEISPINQSQNTPRRFQRHSDLTSGSFRAWTLFHKSYSHYNIRNLRSYRISIP